MHLHKKKFMLALVSTATAISKSPWVTDFDSMLESVVCRDGPKNCGANNKFLEAEYCGAGQGCYNVEILNYERCTSVFAFQCVKECDEGQVLNPLRYCECISEEEQYNMFCAPSASSPASTEVV